MIKEHNTTLARDFYKTFGYVEWRNFEHNIQKIIQLNKSGIINVGIKRIKRAVPLGSGAVRHIVDYEMDNSCIEAIRNMCGAYKLNAHAKRLRNETSMLSLLRKYCEAKNIHFDFQYRLCTFIFDAIVANEILIEFDEVHHINQQENDHQKDEAATAAGFQILRFGIDSDIVDMIVAIDTIIRK